MSIQKIKLPALSLAAALTAAGCAPPASDQGEQTLAVSCDGKCDGFGSVRSLLADAHKLKLDDLLAVGAKETWKAVSGALNLSLGGVSFGDIALKPAKAYGLAADAANDLSLGNIEALVSGLATQYGERELTTQVNATRLRELQAHPGAVFAEAAFRLDVGLQKGFSIGTGGIDRSQTTIGFSAGKQNEMRLVSRVDSARAAYLREPLKAARASKAFIVPTTVDDVAMLQPGEVIARSGAGVVAVNLGASVPLLVGEPVSGLGYGLLFNAALRAQITANRMDVQIARLDGDEVVIDVGVSDGRGISWRVAVEDGWGALAAPAGNRLLGKVELELGKLAEKALGKALGAREKLFSAAVAGGHATARVSVSRLRFNLASLDEKGREALAQTLFGDLRLAQALAWQKAPGVKADFDLFRSGTSATSSAGVDILGMRFFGESSSASGEIIAASPGGARALLFDTLAKAGGWFFNSHSYNRVGLGGLAYDAAGVARAETNLFVQVEHGNKYLTRDALLDHLDAVIREVGGKGALDAIEGAGNQIQRSVQATCSSGNAFTSNDCSKANLAYDERAAAMAALDAAIADLPDDARTMVHDAGKLRLAANAAYEYAAQFTGPKGSAVVDYRIDDASLASLFDSTGASRLKESVYGYLEATNVDRDDSKALADQRTKIRGDKRAKVEALGAVLATVAESYQRLASAERASVEGIGQVGPQALEIRFGLDPQGRADYDSALARSFAEARMTTATQLFDKLRAAASDMGPYAEQVVAHGLLGAMPADHRDVRLTVKFDLPSEDDGTDGHYVTAGYEDMTGHVKATKAAAIDGGLFSIDALLTTAQ